MFSDMKNKSGKEYFLSLRDKIMLAQDHSIKLLFFLIPEVRFENRS
jgi:hypothetical protein